MSDPTGARTAGADAIFISYRRGDTAYPAGWLYHQLVEHFGANQVFKEVDSIELGSDFVAEITDAVTACQCLLALIGRDWLTAVDSRGRRRLDDPADFVRIEIEAALARNVRVIPVLVEDATMPYADELPATLAPITRRQALVLSPTRFTADIAKLITVLERSFAEAAAANEAEQARSRAAKAPDLVRSAEDAEEVEDVGMPVPAAAPPPAVATTPPPEASPATRAEKAEAPHGSREPTNAHPNHAEPIAADFLRRKSRLPTISRRGSIAAPFLFLVASLFPWASDDIGTRDGFSSLTLVLAWILLLVAAGWSLLPAFGRTTLSPLRRSLVTLVVTVLAFACTVLGFLHARWTQMPDIGGFGIPRGAERSALAGAYGGLLIAVAAATLGVLGFVAARKRGKDPAPPSVERRVRIRYLVAGISLLAVATVGVIIHPLSADHRPAPFAGDAAWWSSYGNDLESTLETTEPMDLSGATVVGVTAQITYELEEGYEYLYGETSTDGDTWIPQSGTVLGETIWSDGDIEALTGESGDADENGERDWVPLTYDLSQLGWDGETQVWFRFRYATGPNHVSDGAFIDDVVITYDDEVILSDGAEGAGNGPWSSDGFEKAP